MLRQRAQPGAYNRCVRRRLFIALLPWLVVAGCAAPESLPKPVVAVVSPPDGGQYALGEPILINAAAAATRGVALLELRAGDASVNALASQTNPSLSPTFSARLPFTPTQVGAVVLLITAQDAEGTVSDPASVSLNVVEHVALLTTGTASSGSGSGGGGDSTGGCVPDAEFVADVTIPDNTPVQPKSPFIKTWRVRNSGQCQWEATYALIFLRGDQMNASSRAPVAATPPGASTDISVAFVAPDKPGIYTSTWQLRTTQGVLFGKPIFAVIRVP